MTDYAWYPVTGDGQTPATGYAWTTSATGFALGQNWANVDIPGSPAASAGTMAFTAADNLYLFAGSANSYLIDFYYKSDPSKGYPYIATPADGNFTQTSDVILNSGSVEVGSIGMESIDYLASTAPPTLHVEGATLHIAQGIAQSYGAADLPGFVLPMTFSEPYVSKTIPGGVVDVGLGGLLEVGTTVDPGVTLHFEDGANDTLRFDAGFGAAVNGTVDVSGAITGLGQGDTIDFANLHVSKVLIGYYNGKSLYLTFDNYQTLKVNVTGAGLTQRSQFLVGHDAGGGLTLTEASAAATTCFAAGTRIATPDGERRVEDLAEGDLVSALFAGDAPVRWVGRRRVNVARHPEPRAVRPLRIKAGAFAPGVPCRDAILSPDHSVYADGVLIPLKRLADGDAVAPEPCDEVVYYHVELERHDVLLADGLPVESYLDAGNRDSFENGGRAIRLHPDFASRAWEAEGCAPLAITGPEVDRVRARLAARSAVRRAAARQTAEPQAVEIRPAARRRRAES